MIYLSCPFSEKEECKSLGGKWDPDQKRWYIPDGTNTDKFKKWIVDQPDDNIKEHNKTNSIIELSPSSLDFQISKCHRCFFLSKKLGIQTNNYPPPVFNKLDVIQKDFFIDKDTSFLSKNLPPGHFLSNQDLPSKISSKVLKDKKERSFRLVGIPDLVIKFKNETYGIIDFKTTKISDQKANFYKFQLEAYATIFENPGKINSIETPLLTPVTKLAILQFDPAKIEKINNSICNMSFSLGYVELERRLTNELYDRATLAIDIISKKTPPPLDNNCNDCNFYKSQSEVTIST